MVLWSLIPFAWLWWRLVDHLHVEWSVNPQYSYGYAVPFLCLYLIYHGLRSPRSHSPISAFRFPHCSFSVLWLCGLFLTLLYAPIHLVQEANPEWRLVSWALALDVIGLTFVLASMAHCASRAAQDAFRPAPCASPLAPRALCFPLLFFLVAVPWPTLVEQPVIQGLARANAAATVELVNLFGVPALQHGNVIEVGSGAVGIDEACSGIRSLQATLMLSLFFGEYYALPIARRALCVLAGFGLSSVLNVVRTTLLTWVAARHGTAAIANWHDPAGVGILVACFICLALFAKNVATKAGNASQVPSPRFLELSTLHYRPWTTLGITLCTWVAFAELGTEFWYRSHESRLPAPVTWTIMLPRDNPTFRLLPVSDKTRQFLRYDEALNATWQAGGARKCQAIFLHWKPGRIAVHLAKSHTPEACLPAGGRELVSQSGLYLIPAGELQLPFRTYVVKDESGPVHVFYCLWEDRSAGQSFHTTALTYENRLAPVLLGRRNSGQRSLELALWGFDDDQEAEAEFRRQIAQLVRTESDTRTTGRQDHRTMGPQDPETKRPRDQETAEP